MTEIREQKTISNEVKKKYIDAWKLLRIKESISQ